MNKTDSTLNFSEVPMILSLPCYVTNSKSVKTVPLLATATKVGTSEFIQKVLPGESLPDFLKRIYHGAEKYDMDCSIYAQLISLVLSDKWPKEGGDVVLYIDDEISGPKLWRSKIPEMGYIFALNPNVAEALIKTETIFKGQWVIQIEKNQFIGLTNLGPVVMGLEGWVTCIRDGLLDFSKDVGELVLESNSSALENLLYLRKNLIGVYLELKLLDDWVLYNDIMSAIAEWTPTGITVEYIIYRENELNKLKAGNVTQSITASTEDIYSKETEMQTGTTRITASTESIHSKEAETQIATTDTKDTVTLGKVVTVTTTTAVTVVAIMVMMQKLSLIRNAESATNPGSNLVSTFIPYYDYYCGRIKSNIVTKNSSLLCSDSLLNKRSEEKLFMPRGVGCLSSKVSS
jgi:hypothetical protein